MTVKTEILKVEDRIKYVILNVKWWIFGFSIFKSKGRLNIRFSLDIGKKWK